MDSSSPHLDPDQKPSLFDLSNLPTLPALEHPWCDSSMSPLYVTTWPEQSSVEDITAYMDAVYTWMMELNAPWGTTFDFSFFDASTSTAPQRRAFAEGGKKIRYLVAAHCAGLGLVAPSALIRGIFTAVAWLVPSPCPLQIFATHEQAKAWVRMQIETMALQRSQADKTLSGRPRRLTGQRQGAPPATRREPRPTSTPVGWVESWHGGP